MFIYKYLFVFFFLISLSFSQNYSIGDTVKNFTESICANGNPGSDTTLFSLSDDDESKIIWLSFFTSWCSACQAEAPITESIYNQYKDQGLIVLGVGFEWLQPYSCEDWDKKFGLSFPIVDDSDYDTYLNYVWGDIYDVPMNVILDHNMVLKYRSYGFYEGVVRSEIDSLILKMNNIDEFKHLQLTPEKFEIEDPYPNPFNPSVNINFYLSFNNSITINIYDILGNKVNILLEDKFLHQGHHNFIWKPINLPSGIYFVNYTIDNEIFSKKIAFVK